MGDQRSTMAHSRAARVQFLRAYTAKKVIAERVRRSGLEYTTFSCGALAPHLGKVEPTLMLAQACS